MEQHGPILGPLALVRDMFLIDRDWALFRPAYWVYPSVFYLLPLPLAHVLRLLMVVVAVAGPVVYFHRRGGSRPRLAFILVLVVASCSTLLLGLYFVSLQEVSGAAFIGLGLLIKREGWRIVAWTVAAWFKSPFLLAAHWGGNRPVAPRRQGA